MPALMYPRFPYRALKGEVDFDNGTVKAALAGVYDMTNAHDRWSHFVEATTTGLYSSGGIVVENFSLEHVGNQVLLRGDDLHFLTMSTEVIRGVVFYLDDGNTKPLIAYHRLDAFRTLVNAPYSYYLTDRHIADFTM